MNLLFLGTDVDVNYAARLKPLVGTATVYTLFRNTITLIEVILYCKKKEIVGVFSTNTMVLSKLIEKCEGGINTKPSLDNYAGSYFKHEGIEFVFINPLEQLVTVPYGSFMTRRFISKLTNPEHWLKMPRFNWLLVDAYYFETVLERLKEAYVIAVDIETIKTPLSITCIGYTGIFIGTDNRISSFSYVLPIKDMYDVACMRKLNWETPGAKIFQNGKYDLAYLARYNAPIYNYMWDTANLFHCWYSELPKDLAFLGAFFNREAMYWKDLSKTNDLQEYYRYNALDTWNTACIFISLIFQMPQWAKNNYLMEFPLVFPCHLSEMIGIKRDMVALTEVRKELDTELCSLKTSLNKMLGLYPIEFNVNSVLHNTALRKVLGCSDIKSSSAISSKKIANRHPINALIINKTLEIKKLRKLISTYLRVDEDKKKDTDDKGGAKEFNGRILYSLNPHGTQTARLTSQEHHFWCGLNIQNIPREGPTKRTLIADEGFLFAEVDLEQAETRDTAYAAGEENLISAVESDNDFHSMNASCFFGIPYEEIYDAINKKVLNKPIRQVAKNVNHGANYCMGPGVLIDTMGEKAVWEAKRLLKLPRYYTLLDVANHLLAGFHRTYPGLEGTFYKAVIHEVITTNMLVSRAKHHTLNDLKECDLSWVRYCFGNPLKNKSDKNALIAHVGQNLNSRTLNEAYMRIFYDIAINPTHSNNFKLCPQIHDSILFQFREGHEYFCNMVRERMEIPVTIKGYDGKTRTFIVPAAIKAGKDGKGVKNWGEL